VRSAGWSGQSLFATACKRSWWNTSRPQPSRG